VTNQKHHNLASIDADSKPSAFANCGHVMVRAMWTLTLTFVGRAGGLGKISSTTQETLFRQHRPRADFKPKSVYHQSFADTKVGWRLGSRALEGRCQ
jgi:hypothetical protein